MQSPLSVSYTHLDVYKRQEQDRPVVSRPAVKPAARMKAAPPHRQEAYNKAGRITQGKKGASPESRAGGAEKGGGK